MSLPTTVADSWVRSWCTP